MRGALKGCSALAARRSTPDAPALAPDDAVAVANAFLASVHVRSLAVADRQLSFSLLLELGQVLNAWEHPWSPRLSTHSGMNVAHELSWCAAYATRHQCMP